MKYLFHTSFGKGDKASTELAPELQQYGLRLYIDAWASYVDAGSPLGETENAMYIWYVFNQQSGATQSWTFRN